MYTAFQKYAERNIPPCNKGLDHQKVQSAEKSPESPSPVIDPMSVFGRGGGTLRCRARYAEGSYGHRRQRKVSPPPQKHSFILLDSVVKFKSML